MPRANVIVTFSGEFILDKISSPSSDIIIVSSTERNCSPVTHLKCWCLWFRMVSILDIQQWTCFKEWPVSASFCDDTVRANSLQAPWYSIDNMGNALIFQSPRVCPIQTRSSNQRSMQAVPYTCRKKLPFVVRMSYERRFRNSFSAVICCKIKCRLYCLLNTIGRFVHAVLVALSRTVSEFCFFSLLI